MNMPNLCIIGQIIIHMLTDLFSKHSYLRNDGSPQWNIYIAATIEKLLCEF